MIIADMNIMRSQFLAKTVMLLALSAPSVAYGACNIGQDAKQINEINFGRIKLYGFPTGSLKVEAQHALSDGDSWPFTLRTPGNHIGIAVTAPGVDMSQSLSMDAVMDLERPITGYIVERISGGSCRRELRLNDNILVGNSIHARSGRFGTSFGGKIPLSGLKLEVEKQTGFADSKGQTTGTFQLVGSNIKIVDASIGLPTVNELRVPVDFKTIQGGTLEFELPVSTLIARIGTGAIASNPVVLTSKGGAELVFHEMRISAPRFTIASIAAEFRNYHPTLSFDGWNVITPSRLTLSLGLSAQANDIKLLKIGHVSGEDNAAARGMLSLKPELVVVKSAYVVADRFTLFDVNNHPLISGGGRGMLESLSKLDIDCTATIDKPLVDPPAGVVFAYAFSSVKVHAGGSKSNVAITGDGVFSSLQFGTLIINKATIPFSFAKNINGASVDIVVSKGVGALSLNSNGSVQFGGVARDLTIRASFGGYYNSTLEVDLPPGGASADVSPGPFQVPIMGGTLSLKPGNIHISNGFPISMSSKLAGGRLTLGQPNFGLAGLQLRPRDLSEGIAVQGGEVQRNADKFLFDIDPLNPGPISIDIAFDLPGFQIQPPTPIKSVLFEIGGFDVEVTSLAVKNFRVALSDSELTVLLRALSIGVGQFSPKAPEPGQSIVQPNLSGVASRPFEIDQASLSGAITPLPPSFAEFDIGGLTFGASQLTYIGPSGIKATSGSAEVNIASLTARQTSRGKEATIDGSIALLNTNVAWWGSPNGLASVDKLAVTLHGEAQKPDGSLSLNASQVTVSGGVNIPLGTKPDGNHGCSLVVPANGQLTLTDLFGTLAVAKGNAHGVIESDGGSLGEFSYFGHQDCRFNQPVQLFSVTISYPCIGTWKDPVRTCTSTIRPIVTVGMVFAVKAFDANVQPYKTFFNIENNGLVGACSISISKLYPKVPPIFSIAPQIPIGGDVAKIVNDIISFATGAVESTLVAGLLDLYSAMVLVGFGEANPVQGNNCPSS